MAPRRVWSTTPPSCAPWRRPCPAGRGRCWAPAAAGSRSGRRRSRCRAAAAWPPPSRRRRPGGPPAWVTPTGKATWRASGRRSRRWRCSGHTAKGTWRHTACSNRPSSKRMTKQLHSSSTSPVAVMPAARRLSERPWRLWLRRPDRGLPLATPAGRLCVSGRSRSRPGRTPGWWTPTSVTALAQQAGGGRARCMARRGTPSEGPAPFHPPTRLHPAARAPTTAAGRTPCLACPRRPSSSRGCRRRSRGLRRPRCSRPLCWLLRRKAGRPPPFSRPGDKTCVHGWRLLPRGRRRRLMPGCLQKLWASTRPQRRRSSGPAPRSSAPGPGGPGHRPARRRQRAGRGYTGTITTAEGEARSS